MPNRGSCRVQPTHPPTHPPQHNSRDECLLRQLCHRNLQHSRIGFVKSVMYIWMRREKLMRHGCIGFSAASKQAPAPSITGSPTCETRLAAAPPSSSSAPHPQHPCSNVRWWVLVVGKRGFGAVYRATERAGGCQGQQSSSAANPPAPQKTRHAHPLHSMDPSTLNCRHCTPALWPRSTNAGSGEG